ncbi:MAG TPA: hypothetical protein VMB34_22430 [Acetobacteraceae bacterium]|nr:hypothetical protein [Acetobacteraceae bacterium]
MQQAAEHWFAAALCHRSRNRIDDSILTSPLNRVRYVVVNIEEVLQDIMSTKRGKRKHSLTARLKQPAGFALE